MVVSFVARVCGRCLGLDVSMVWEVVAGGRASLSCSGVSLAVGLHAFSVSLRFLLLAKSGSSHSLSLRHNDRNLYV